MNKISTFTAAASIASLLLAPVGFAEQGMPSETGSESTYSSPGAAGSAASQDRESMESATQTNQETTTTSTTRTTMAGQKANILKASEVIGYSVKNPQGEELGQIEDLAVDPESGRIAYAVLSAGGFLGMGDKLFAVPWEALTMQPEEQTFNLNVDKEKLQNAPGFDKSDWPDMASREWGTTVHEYYGQKPYWEKQSETTTSTTRSPSVGESSPHPSAGEPSSQQPM